MDLSGFSIYQGAFNVNLSLTAEKGIWDMNINRALRLLSYPVKDYFYFSSFNTYKDLEKYIISIKNKRDEENKLLNITKTSKTSFIIMSNPPTYSNKNYYYFGIIGLRLNEQYYLDGPEFIISFKKENYLKSYTFSFIFNKDNYTYNNFFNNNHEGYFIIGEELVDEKNKKDKILYTNTQRNEKGLSWCIYFNKIYSKISNFEFKTQKLGGEFVLNLPYLIGTNDYLDYINNTFFNELIQKKLCYYNNGTKNKKELYSFICNSQSLYLMNYLNYNFPDLVFEHKELEENFILNKYDLFSFNNFNKSDTNLYFLVLFRDMIGYNKNLNWTLGIPFLKKYRLSFNYDSKKIGYYKIDENKNIEKLNKEENKLFNGIFIKIIFIIILIIIIFILGMFYQKRIIKKQRKIKANELEDNYEYDSYKNINNKDINKINNNIKEVELGLKLIK